MSLTNFYFNCNSLDTAITARCVLEYHTRSAIVNVNTCKANKYCFIRMSQRLVTSLEPRRFFFLPHNDMVSNLTEVHFIFHFSGVGNIKYSSVLESWYLNWWQLYIKGTGRVEAPDHRKNSSCISTISLRSQFKSGISGPNILFVMCSN